MAAIHAKQVTQDRPEAKVVEFTVEIRRRHMSDEEYAQIVECAERLFRAIRLPRNKSEFGNGLIQECAEALEREINRDDFSLDEPKRAWHGEYQSRSFSWRAMNLLLEANAEILRHFVQPSGYRPEELYSDATRLAPQIGAAIAAIRSEDGKGPTKARAQDGRKATQPAADGDARAKIIAALNKHHDYASDGPLNTLPIVANALAKQLGVGKASVSRFFKGEFGGHRLYKQACADRTKLLAALKLLNGDYAPRVLLSKSEQ